MLGAGSAAAGSSTSTAAVAAAPRQLRACRCLTIRRRCQTRIRAVWSRPASPTQANDHADALAAAASTATALLTWMQQQGCTVHGVDLQYELNSSGQLCRELRATQNLSPGDVLVSVPLNCTIHYRNEPPDDQPLNNMPASNEGSSSSSSSDDSSSVKHAALRRLQSRVPAASDGSRGAWQFKMALQVLYHACDAGCPLQPYIQTLPGACSGIPTPQVAMLWPQQQLQECQYAPLLADAASQAYWWEAYSRDVLAQLPGCADDPFGGQLVTQERLGWALAVSMSRAFGFKKLGGYALAPLIDMCNHAPVSNAEVRFSEDTGRVNLIANKQVAAGSAIFINYGSHDNSNLLLSYGFAVADNAADRFCFPLDMDVLVAAITQFVGGDLPPTGRATDSLKQWQRTALQNLGLMRTPSAATSSTTIPPAAGRGSSHSQAQHEQQQQQKQQPELQQQMMVSIGGEPPVSGPLLAAVRVVLASERASIKGKSMQQLGDWDQPLSIQHEALVMKALVGLCTILYKAFPTSIQQDRAALATLQQEQQQQQQQEPQQQLGYQSTGELLAAERSMTAVQFRLNLKLLLERSTKVLLQRLKQLAAQL